MEPVESVEPVKSGGISAKSAGTWNLEPGGTLGVSEKTAFFEHVFERISAESASRVAGCHGTWNLGTYWNLPNRGKYL